MTKQYLDQVFPDHGIDVNTPVSELFLAQRQMIEIAKAISHASLKILILDEPASSLTGDRILQLHDAIRSLGQQGIAIIVAPKRSACLAGNRHENHHRVCALAMERIHNLYTMSHEMLYVPRDIGLRISDDTAAVMSPKLYQEFGVRYNARLSEAFGGLVIHSCGDVRHVVPVMQETPGLRGLDLTITQVTKWEKVRDAAVGKTALNLRHFFWDHPGENSDLLAYNQQLVEVFGRRGIFLQMSTRTPQEAVILGQQLRHNGRDHRI